MAFNVTLYTFSKKVNSTARPTGGTEYQCVLKQPSGILKPIICLNLGNASPALFNYAYIPDYSRFYFIDEWTYENAMWCATMEVDVLASWKTAIGAASCYILRSASESNGDIIDTSYVGINTTSIVDDAKTESPWNTLDMALGTYCVGIAGQSTTYYLFNSAALNQFFGYLFSNDYAAKITENWSSTFPQLKAQCNPLQYITSIMWFPFIPSSGAEVNTIRVGWADVPCTAHLVDGTGIVNGTLTWTLQNHPQAASRGKYLNNSPYSHYVLFFPPFGTIPLESDCLANATTISAQWIVDLRTGVGTLFITSGDTHIISWTHAPIGVQYQVSQVVNRGYGLGNMIMPAVATAANALSGNYLGAGATALGEVGNFAASKIPSATTIGSNGGIDSLKGMPSLQYEFKLIAEEDNDDRGRPLFAIRRISSLSGFIKAMNPFIDISATQIEKNKISDYMEGGFFFE